jgi:hypothetical protein
MVKDVPPEALKNLFGNPVELDLTEILGVEAYPPEGVALRFRIPDGQVIVLRIRIAEVRRLQSMFEREAKRFPGPSDG